MGKILPLQRKSPWARFGNQLDKLPRRWRLNGPAALSLSLIAAVVFIGAWGFFGSNDRAGIATGFMGGQSCHPSYSGQCLPMGHDLDCNQIAGTVRVVGWDVYRLDADGDGIGCEPL